LTTKKEPDEAATTTVPVLVVVVSENKNQQGSNVPKRVVYQDDDVPMDDDDEDGNTNPSSEKAGIVRGATKTILRGSKKRAGGGVRMTIRRALALTGVKCFGIYLFMSMSLFIHCLSQQFSCLPTHLKQ